MTIVKVRGIKDEVVAFLDRKAKELSKETDKTISRNQYINLILEKELRNDLSIRDEKIDYLAEGIYELSSDLKKYVDTNNRLLNSIVED